MRTLQSSYSLQREELIALGDEKERNRGLSDRDETKEREIKEGSKNMSNKETRRDGGGEMKRK